MKVQYDNGKKRTRRFFRKKSGSFKNGKNVPKIKVFWTLLKNGSYDFDGILSESSA
jgi:hypothetical protein